VVGAKVWGTLLEVTRQRLVVSLPHGLRGFVAPVAAGDIMHSLLCKDPTPQQTAFRRLYDGPPPSLPDLFHPGQYVSGVITDLEQGQETDTQVRTLNATEGVDCCVPSVIKWSSGMNRMVLSRRHFVQQEHPCQCKRCSQGSALGSTL
jgi:hypothetical protein